MKKSLIMMGIILTLALVFQVGGVVASADLSYQTIGDGTISVTGYSGQPGVVNIPEQINGQKVTAIADEAFMNNGLVHEVVVPEGVISIGRSAFQGSYNLRSISLPQSLRSIGSGAFHSAGKLESISIPDGITTLAEYTFFRCLKLEDIVLPSTLKSIGDYSLAITGVSDITLPDNLESIGSHAFYGSAQLESIVIPNRVASIGDFAFFVSERLSKVVLPAGRLSTIPAGVFNQCPSLVSVAIPTTVSKISDDAFFTGSLKSDSLIIYTPKGSEGEAFAKRNGLNIQNVANAITVELLKDGVNVAGQVVSIDLSSNTRTFNINARAYPDPYWAGIEFSSSSSNVATVDSTGQVIAHGKGEATISATAVDGSGAKASIKVNIANLANAIEIEGTESLKSKGKATLSATVLPSSADDKNVDWFVSDENIATITAKGILQAKETTELKTILVTAKAKDGSGAYAEHEVIIQPLVSEIVVSAQGQEILNKDVIDFDIATGQSTIAIQASTLPADADQSLSWKSSASKVATVDEIGNIYIHGKGKAVITVSSTDGTKKTMSFTLNVVSLAKEVSITGEGALASGQKATLKATVFPESASSKKLTWHTSDESVAKVNTSGVVTAQKTDTIKEVIITATATDSSGVSASHRLTVHPVAEAVIILHEQQVLENKQTLEMTLGTQISLSALVESEDAIQSVSWKSENERVASIDENGQVVASRKGTTIITATAQDGSRKRSSIEIKVVQ